MTPAQTHPHSINRQSAILVFLCTLSGAAAQIFLKMGANNIAHPTVMQILTNYPLLLGYFLYGVNTLMIAIALKHAPLSLLWPIISLTYVWVMLLSLWVFRESLNTYKIAGVAIIMGGIVLLGFSGDRKQ